jgi:hypothetical protein
MSENNDSSMPPSDAALIDTQAMQNALELWLTGHERSPLEILPNEPVLSAYVHGELFAVLGKLALTGAETEVVRGVSADLHRIVGITASAFRLAYYDLIKDLLPDIHADAPGTPDQTERQDERENEDDNEDPQIPC